MDDWIYVKVPFVEFREDTATVTDEFIDVNDVSNLLITGSTICSFISSLSLSSSVLLYMVFTIKLCEEMLLPNEVDTCNQKSN